MTPFCLCGTCSSIHLFKVAKFLHSSASLSSFFLPPPISNFFPLLCPHFLYSLSFSHSFSLTSNILLPFLFPASQLSPPSELSPPQNLVYDISFHGSISLGFFLWSIWFTIFFSFSFLFPPLHSSFYSFSSSLFFLSLTSYFIFIALFSSTHTLIILFFFIFSLFSFFNFLLYLYCSFLFLLLSSFYSFHLLFFFL
ncbi:unnamed protein product [Acanthosepion pharaonis]|uniref:Uncharacterized protein n=1 Tax=Acanthosepion pharaonis TaxID=158019 RepID=A0A812AUE6_ACAPH|nr:unnamed protein product [Sepia pharaonis]